MKRIITTVCAVACIGTFAHDKSYDALYTAATGYVTLNADDSGNGANSSFHSAKGWSDKDVPPNYGVPHAGTNYYVKAGKVLVLDDVANRSEVTGFAGDSIVVGGQVKMNGSWGKYADCGPLTMLPDSDFYWVNVGHVVGGSVHVKGTGTSTVMPVVFRSGRSGDTSLFTMDAFMSFSSDADGELYWKLESGRNIGVTFTILDDWSGFPGTFRIGRNHTFKTQNGRYQMPGNLIITTNATLQLTASTGQSEIGALTIQANGVLNLSAANGSQTVRISKKLELEPGALVIPQSFSGNHLAAQAFHPVFELTAEAVAAGLPDFSSLPVPICGRTQSLVNGHEPVLSIFPALEWAVRDAEGGGKTVGFSYKETVAVTNNMNYGGNGFINGTGAADPAKFWADGQYPQKGKGYYGKSINLVLQGAGNPYVFPGDSFMLNAGAFAIYANSGDLTISNLVLCGTGRVRLMSKDSSGYHLRGTIRTLRKDANPAFRFNGGDRCTQFIDSDISGDGMLRFDMDTEVATASYEKTLPVGTFELTGDNSAFSGKMQVDCWQTVPYSERALKFDPAFQPGPYSNITLRVSSQANLGGALPEVTYDALTVSNECRLTLLSTAEFNEPTRGWFFPENAYLKVEDGAVATVTSPITYGTKLVKEGAGTLMLGGTPAVASGVAERPQVKVDGGSVGFVSSTAIAGLDVDFSAGTSLRVLAAPSDAGLAERGVDLTDASITSESAIPVKVDMTGVDIAASGRISVAVCTVPEASVSDYENLFTVGKVAPACASKLTWVSNPDSTKTLCVVASKVGFRIFFR